MITRHLRAWWIYQQERFPLVAHGLLILIFSFSILAYTQQLQGQSPWPDLALFLSAFLSCFALFFLLRVADEYKDLEEDKKFRPYRPVPRGLISLKQLTLGALLLAGIQLLLTLRYNPQHISLLLLLWGYFSLMSREFFIHHWLKQHPVVYMLSHMLIMPLLILHISSFAWQNELVPAQQALLIFLFLGFINGMIIEVGRKIRTVEDEEVGVETYSALWGRKKASYILLLLLLLSAISAVVAASYIQRTNISLLINATIWIIAAVIIYQFIRKPKSGKSIENLSGLWIMISYLHLALPY